MSRRPATHLSLFAVLSALAVGAAPARPVAIVLDGLRDPAYILLATDPAGDLPSLLALSSLTDWADLTALYVYTTTTELYVFVDLPNYAHDRSSGQIGLAIDTTGDVPASGGGSDPWTNPITYAFTSTNHITGGVPLATSNTILPDVVVRGDIAGVSPGSDVDNNNGWTELRSWNGAAWLGQTVNWGGLGSGEQLGDRIAYADYSGVELAIPLADLGVVLSSTLNLHFFTTQRGNFHGAYDTLPSDWPVTSAFSPTVQHNLATFQVGSGSGPAPELPTVAFSSQTYQAGEADGIASVAVVAGGVVTQPISATFKALPGTASSLDFVPLTTTLTLSPSLTTIPISITLLTDNEFEPAETILLSLTSPLNAILGQPASAILTLLDDDALYRLFLPLVTR